MAAKVALHNVCIWINQTLGRLPMASAELIKRSVMPWDYF